MRPSTGRDHEIIIAGIDQRILDSLQSLADTFALSHKRRIAAMPWTARLGSRRAVVAFTGLRPASEKRQDLLVIRELAEASALVPVVGACYPLARIADAYRHVDAGHKKGTIVVAMS